MKKILALSLCSLIFNINLFSDQNEVASYTAQKHKVDFYKQELNVKEVLSKEYGKVEKLAQILEKDKMKNDINLKTAKNIPHDFHVNRLLQIARLNFFQAKNNL